jgi:hypothetical protein
MFVVDCDSVFSNKGSLNLQHVHAEILVVQAQALPKEVRVSGFPKFPSKGGTDLFFPPPSSSDILCRVAKRQVEFS